MVEVAVAVVDAVSYVHLRSPRIDFVLIWVVAVAFQMIDEAVAVDLLDV